MAQPTRTRRRKRRHLRLRKRVQGTPAQPRLNVYRSLRHIYAQVIDDSTGRVLAAASTQSKDLPAAYGGNIAAAKQVGTAIATQAKAAGVDRVVFDRGGWQFHGRVKALADAARAAGLQV